jgi:alpha-glucosidase
MERHVSRRRFVASSLKALALGAVSTGGATLLANQVKADQPIEASLGPKDWRGKIKLRSPNKKLVAQIGNFKSGRVGFEILRDGREIIAPSPLGMLVDEWDFGQNVKLGQPRFQTIDETYPLPGWHATATNQCCEAAIPVEHIDSGQHYEILIRVFDNGIAIRYVIPLDGIHLIKGEQTSWRLPSDAEAWWSPFESSNEELFRGSLFSLIPNSRPLEGLVTLHLHKQGVYVAISEADCLDYPDAALRREGDYLRPHFWACEKGWSYDGWITTPWRVAVIASDLTALVNNDIFPNLCPPPQPELLGADWIRPGRVLWQWYSSGAPKLEEQPAWYDAAAKLNWEYYLIDDGWRDWSAPGKDQWQCLKEVISYGKTKGVDSLVWVNSSEMQDADGRRRYLEKVKAIGASGIKIDFIPPATPEIMRWYEGALRDTADLKLLCNFHGAVKPTGRRRTWPHELTRESVRGHEWHITRYNRTMPKETDTIIPFTRYLLGPADYTPTAFDPEQLRGFTWARELAQAIVFTSPLTHFADSYKQYIGNPAEDILRTLPTVWDETQVLDGTEIGKIVAFARRKGRDWYIGVMNGAEPKEFSIQFEFLKEGRWQGTLFSDSPNKDDAFDLREREMGRREKIALQLRPGGGFVARIIEIHSPTT